MFWQPVSAILTVLVVLAFAAIVNREPRDLWCSLRADRQLAREQCRKEAHCKLNISDLQSEAEYMRYCAAEAR